MPATEGLTPEQGRKEELRKLLQLQIDARRTKPYQRMQVELPHLDFVTFEIIPTGWSDAEFLAALERAYGAGVKAVAPRRAFPDPKPAEA